MSNDPAQKSVTGQVAIRSQEFCTNVNMNVHRIMIHMEEKYSK